jgi:hypothetical protein
MGPGKSMYMFSAERWQISAERWQISAPPSAFVGRTTWQGTESGNPRTFS